MIEGQAKLVVHGRPGVDEGNRLIGESIMFNREQKISATMACPNCSSEPIGLTLSPTSINNVIGTSWSLSAQVTYLDNSTWTANLSDAINWTESNFNIVEVVVIHDPIKNVDRFHANLKGPGSASISATVNHCPICDPCRFPETLLSNNSIQVTVRPKVSITAGANKVPLDSSGQPGVTKSIQRTATGDPAGGTFSWSTTSTKVSLSNTTSATVTITSVSASTSRNDVTITVTYTVNGQSSSASTQITVVKPSSLTVISTNLNPTGLNCSTLNCNTYLRTIDYQIRDQFGDTFGPWDFHTRESFTNFSSNCTGVTSPPTPSSVVIRGIGFIDQFAICTVSCPQCNPNATGCTASTTQEWFANGFSVRRNRVTWTCSDATVQQIQ